MDAEKKRFYGIFFKENLFWCYEVVGKDRVTMKVFVAIGNTVTRVETIDFLCSNEAGNPTTLQLWRLEDKASDGALCVVENTNKPSIDELLSRLAKGLVDIDDFVHIGMGLFRLRNIHAIFIKSNKTRHWIYVEVVRSKLQRTQVITHGFSDLQLAQNTLEEIRAWLVKANALRENRVFIPLKIDAAASEKLETPE